jgi:hypothetical protein
LNVFSCCLNPFTFTDFKLGAPHTQLDSHKMKCIGEKVKFLPDRGITSSEVVYDITNDKLRSWSSCSTSDNKQRTSEFLTNKRTKQGEQKDFQISRTYLWSLDLGPLVVLTT